MNQLDLQKCLLKKKEEEEEKKEYRYSYVQPTAQCNKEMNSPAENVRHHLP